MKKQIAISASALTGILFLIIFIFSVTTPDRIGPVGITGVFFLIFGAFFVIFDLVWRVATSTRRQPKYNMYFIAVLAGLPTILIALQSLDQLEIRDVIFVFLLATVVIFYISKRR